MFKSNDHKQNTQKMDTTAHHTFTKERQPQASQNYHTISLINQFSKIMLQVILYPLKAKAKELLAEEQAGVRPGQSTKRMLQ